MEELLTYILKNIVQNPEDVSVTHEQTDEEGQFPRTIYFVSVKDEDIGIVIGKEGRTIKSIRNILKVKAIKTGQYIDVRILEDQPRESRE